MVDLEEDIKQCVDVLRKGGTILYPTDTVWGLGCDALNEASIEKVFRIKQRPKDKSLIVLLAEPREVLQYVAAPHPDIIDILGGFNRPTTVIYDGPLDFPESLIHETGTIAIRVTDDPFCKALIKRYRRPIVSTSANISGAPTPATYSEISDVIRQEVDYVVKYRREDTRMNPPSRLVRLQDDGCLEILRA